MVCGLTNEARAEAMLALIMPCKEEEDDSQDSPEEELWYTYCEQDEFEQYPEY